VLSPGRVASDRLSADAVSLEVPVNIHGSRITEAVRGAPSHTEPFEEQTTTMIVFPQGGVLRMATTVIAGQILVLTNLKSRQDAICRVVKVRTYSSVASYVEVEFTHPQAGYWGVFFSSDGPELAKKASGNLSLESLEPALESKPAPVSPVANPSTASVPRPVKETSAPSPLGIPLNRNESSFISIGSQEEVQLSATSTTFKGGTGGTLENQRPISPVQKDQPSAAQAARPILETREPRALSDTATATETPNASEEKSPAATVSNQNPAGTFGEVFGGSSRPKASPELSVSSSSPSNSQNWKLLAGGAILGIVVAAGAFFLLRPSANGNATAKSAAPSSAEVQPVVTQPAEATAPPSTPTPTPTPTPTRSATRPVSPALPKNDLVAEAKKTESSAEPAVKTPKQEPVPQAEQERPAPVAKHNVPDVTSDLFGSLNAHPVAGRTAEKNQAEIAPTVSASAPASLSPGGTAEIIPSTSTVDLPVPSQTIPGAVLQAGGSVPEPRLLSSTLPIYPAAAKQTRTQGDIMVRTVIDEHGQVTNPQVVSGPTLLRQAAIDAVKHWKYEPSHVNGKPVPVQILLTIHFRL
jgi:TonB family protein